MYGGHLNTVFVAGLSFYPQYRAVYQPSTWPQPPRDHQRWRPRPCPLCPPAANIVLQVVDAGESPPCWTPWLLPLSPHTSGGKYFSEHLNIFQMNSFMLRDRENKVVCCPGETFSRQNIWCIKSVNVVLWNTLGAHFIFENILTPVNLASGDLAL